MADWAVYIFLFILTLLCGALGFCMHYWRANFSLYPENLTDNSFLDGMMSNQDIVFEKHIVEAKWDDNGYWDLYSYRNIVYYVLTWASMPLVLALFDWRAIKFLGDAFCRFMTAHGVHSLLCN